MQRIKFKRRKNYKKYFILVIYLLVASVLISSHSVATIYAKYRSVSTSYDTARVAKFGELELYEYTIDGNELISGTTARIENVDLITGKDVNKNLSLKYYGSEVTSYLYFVINTNSWKLYVKDEVNKLVLENENKDHLMYIEIDNSWTYLEDISENGKYILYKTIEPNIAHNEQIIKKVNVNSISMNDSKKLKNIDTSLSFDVHAVQITDETPSEGWTNVE